MKTSRPFAALCRIIVCSILALALGRQSALAQPSANPPGQLSYQGFLVDNNGIPLATNAPKNYNIIFRIYGSATGDTNSPVWAEQQVVTVDKGYFSVLLGQGSQVGNQPNTNNLSGLFTGNTASDRYVGLVVQGLATGGDVEIAPRLRLLASPYAFLAANAISVVNSSGSNILSTFGNFVGINKQGANPASALDVAGTVTATTFSGSGAGITAINANNIATGTLADARLSGNIPLLNGSQTFTGSPFINNLGANSISAYTGISLISPAQITFNSTLGNKVTLFTGYSSGIQNNTLYSRSGAYFSWFVGGTHSDTQNDPGSGGTSVLQVGNGFANFNGNITSPKFNYSVPVPYGSVTYPGYGLLPRTGTFSCGGGLLDICAACTGYVTSTGSCYVAVTMDGGIIGYLQLYFNQTGIHTTFPPIHFIVRYSAGNHTVGLAKYSSAFTYDNNDVSQITVTEYPF